MSRTDLPIRMSIEDQWTWFVAVEWREDHGIDSFSSHLRVFLTIQACGVPGNQSSVKLVTMDHTYTKST